MKITIKHTCKITSAALFAFCILNVICRFYYNVPVLFPSTSGATDGHLEANWHWIRGVEGFGFGKLNNEGFNNIEEYNSQQVAVLVMGSSQMEGMQVPQNKMATSLLNELFGDAKYAYNIGVGSQNVINTIKHFDTAINYYNLTKGYAVIETQNIKLDLLSLGILANQQFEQIEPARLKIDFAKDPIHSLMVSLQYSFLRKIPYMRLLAFQLNTILRNNNGGGGGNINIRCCGRR